MPGADIQDNVFTPAAVKAHHCSEFTWPRLWERPYACLGMAIALAGAIRVSLFFRYYCISSDGVRYINSGQDFYAGQISAGLSSVYPPLYPLLIAALYPLVGNWEIAGQLWSLAAGVLLLIPLFALLRSIYGNSVAVVGVFLCAMAPFLARYSAHVRTEAPYIFLSTVALLLFYGGIKDRVWSRFFYGGLITGLAYLTRPEAIGLLVVIPLALMMEWWANNSLGFRGVMIGSILTLLAFLLVAGPYAVHLAMSTGDWGAISRKTGYAIWYGFKDTGLFDETELAAIREPGAPGLTKFFLEHPVEYLKKFALDLPPSFAVYFEAVYYSYVPFLVLGSFYQARQNFRRRNDHLILIFVLFHIFAFAALYVNLRYAIQLVPASLGWVAIGILWCLNQLELSRHASPRLLRVAVAVLLVGFIGGTLGKTLLPISPEKAYVRESGLYLRNVKSSDGLKVLVFDERIAFYAQAQPVQARGLDEAAVIRVVRQGEVHYVATEMMPWQQQFPKIAQNPADFGLVLEKEFHTSGRGKILLYKVRRV